MKLKTLQQRIADDEVLVFRIQDLQTGQGPATCLERWPMIVRHINSGAMWCNEEPCNDPALKDKYCVSGFRFGTTCFDDLMGWFGGAFRQLDAHGFGVCVFVCKKADVHEGRKQAVFNTKKAREIAWFACLDSIERLSAFYN